MGNDPTYKSLRFLLADENKIFNLLPLEGSSFIEHYAELSLKFNQLKSVSILALYKTIENNSLNFK